MPSLRLLRLGLVLLLAVAATAARAEMKPFELNMDRVKVSDPKGLNAKTYFVPSFNLAVSYAGSVWAQSKAGGSNAQAHGKFYVRGLDKALLQGLAQKLQDDLVAKLRALGATVLTYDDLKAEALIVGHGRLTPDAKWGFPTFNLDPLSYLRVSPTDAQAFERGLSASPIFWVHPLSKEKNLITLLPEIVFTVPQMWGEVEAGYKRDSAGIAVNSAMMLMNSYVYVDNPQGSFTGIMVQQHGKRLASEVTGTVKLMNEDKTEFSKAWQRSSTDWVMTLDQQAFSDGVLRVGYAINTMVADQVKKVRK